VLVAGLLFPLAGGFGVLSNRASDTVDNISGNLAQVDPPLVATMTDSNGKPFGQLFDQYRLPAAPNQISNTMKAAIIAVEDRRFYQHSGVDWRGTLRAAINDTTGGSTQGASTITQQYVKNYLVNVVDRNDPVEKQKDQEQTIARKLREARIAMQVEQKMTKDQILAGYLNVVAFGANTYGVGAAAKVFYGTTPEKLNISQSALLAGIVNNPISLNPWKNPQEALDRRNQVIDRMVDNKSISTEQGNAAKSAQLGIKPEEDLPSKSCIGARRDAGFFCDYVTQYLADAGFSYDDILSGGYTIKTSLDSKLSLAAKRNVEERVRKTEDGVGHSFAVIQPGQNDHRVLTMTSNRDYGYADGESLTNQVSGVSNVFGGGSSFKVFTAAAAMENGRVGLSTPLRNPSSTTVCPPIKPSLCSSVSNLGSTSPSITLRSALAESPNTGFVNLAMDTGLPRVLRMAERLGLRRTMFSNAYGGDPDTTNAKASKNPDLDEPQMQRYQNVPVFTLGVSPVSPLEMANVSATLMSGGKWCQPDPIIEVRDRYGRKVPIPHQPCEQVVSPPLAHSLMAGLSDDSVSGTSATAAAAAGWKRPDIGKTGTTQDNKSVAFVGGVNDYAVSSMVFADGNEPGSICPSKPATLGVGCEAFGGTLAAPTFFETFTQILGGQPSKPIPPPDPAFDAATPHGPIVPYVSGRMQERAQQILASAGYQVQIAPFNSPKPKGTVVGQSPQGNIGKNTPIVLYVSTGSVPKLR
jgi:membrane peptidoglycan carboxypeptidase